MPKVAKRFQIFFTISLVLQAVPTLLGLTTDPAYALGTLMGCALWAALGVAAFRGSDGARKFIVFFAYVGAAAAAVSAIGGTILALTEMTPLVIAIVIQAFLSFFLSMGVAVSAGDKAFSRWAMSKAIQRADAKPVAV